MIGQVARALEHAHRAGVIHRDVKPSNVLVDAALFAKLADFGLAREIGRGHTLTAPGVVLGTPAYLSPEQVTGDRLGPATDQYSLAVMLFQFATGSLPFNDPDLLKAMPACRS